MDSVVNFVDAANADEGDWVIGYIICGIVELGGIIYVLIVLIILSLTMPLAQAANFFTGIAYDTIVILSAAAKAANEEEARGGNENES